MNVFAFFHCSPHADTVLEIFHGDIECAVNDIELCLDVLLCVNVAVKFDGVSQSVSEFCVIIFEKCHQRGEID